MVMAEVGPAEAAQQYFPTYRVPPDKEEVTLREYDLSVQALAADQRSISLATGLAVVIISFSGTLLGSENGVNSLQNLIVVNGKLAELALFAIVLGISLVALRYFSELQRSATHAARKIIVLRRLLGVDYGNVERVLPAHRIEGANEPYAIHLFPGWGSIGPLASIIVAAFAAILLAMLLGAFSQLQGSLSSAAMGVLPNVPYLLPLMAGLIAVGLLLVYRSWLLESWETPRFLVGRAVAHEVSVPLKQRLGHVLYRSELAVHEAKRVGILLESFVPILLFLEDRGFYRHNGNDWQAVAKALYRWIRYGLKAGGSTLDQQLFRSTCLSRLDRTWARKPVEWAMAPWLRDRYGADQIIQMYLCAVRFDRGVIGLPAAAAHFFDAELHSSSNWVPTRAQVFFLVERLSNITRTIPQARVRALIAGLLKADLLQDEDVPEIEAIYLDQVRKGLIRGTLDKLRLSPIIVKNEDLVSPVTE